MFGTGLVAQVARTLEKPVYLVVNMIPLALREADVPRVVNKIGLNFKIQVLGWLPFSEEVVNSLSKSAFVLSNPRHPMSKRFFQLAEKLESLSRVNEVA
jgi:MinD-like ATPase involved in chromosome partitioning or flagellar assembly